MYVACKGLSDLGNGPNKPTATIIGESSASLQDAALVFNVVRARISDSDKNLATFLTTHHSCLASSQCVYIACKELSDLGNGPNKPTPTIIGECSASWQDSALVFTLVRERISDSDKNLTHHIFDHTSLMSGMFPVCM